MGALINLSSVLDRPAPQERSGSGERATFGIAAALLVADVALFAAVWEPAHWRPAELVVVLAAFTMLGELAAVRYGPLYISSTSCATVLAIALLGPVPAAAIAAVASALEWIVDRKPAWAGVTNLSIAATAALGGGALLAVADAEQGVAYAVAVFGCGLVVLAVNVLLLGLYRRLRLRVSPVRDFIDAFLPTTPYQLLGITFATGAAQIVATGGLPTLVAVVPALVVSEFVLRYVGAERTRAEQVMALTEERADLLEQALSAEVAERRWIAGHIHDETLQTLAVARQDVEEAIAGNQGSLTTALADIDAAVGELRRTLVHVHPASVAGHGLGPTLDAYAGQVLSRSEATWTVDVDPDAAHEHEALLYSLARELLGNAGKHAHAGHVDLRIAREGEVVRLTVADDGVGLEPGAAGGPEHFGLLTARHRAAAAGGQLTVTSAPGEGCVVTVELPIAT